MVERKRILRSFLYLNENIVDDYLSQLEGGIIEGPYTTKDVTSKGKEGGVGLNIAGITGSGKGNAVSSSEIQQTIRETPAAKFTRLYDLLDEEKLIQSLNGFDLMVYEEIQAGEIVEVRGMAKLPEWERFAKGISGITGFVDLVKGLNMDPFNGDPASAAAYEGVTSLIDKKAKKDIELIISPIGSPKIKFVANLDEAHLRREKEDFEAELTILGKVRSKLSKGEKIDIFRLAPRLDELQHLSRDQRRNAKKKLQGTDSPFDEVIAYPAMRVQPIAVYQ